MPKPRPNPDANSGSPKIGSLEDLFRDYSGKVYGLALSLGLDRQDAEDGVQEVFLKLQRKIGTFRGEAAFSTWLYRVALNTLRDHRRRSARQTRSFSFSLLKGGENDSGDAAASPQIEFEDERRDAQPAESAEVRERSALVREALENLPPRFREVLVLRELEGMRYRDIARILQIAQGTVESRIHRARERLGQELKRMEESL